MEPVLGLALKVAGWGALSMLSLLVTAFFWPAFVVTYFILVRFFDRLGEFKFVWENSRG